MIECYYYINFFEYEKYYGNNDAYVIGVGVLEF